MRVHIGENRLILHVARYKDIHKVADVSHRLGIGRKVMMSTPIAVAKN